MKIEFTNGQYRTLLLLTHIGEWVINAHRETGLDEDASGLHDHLLAQHKDFDAQDLVDPKPDHGKIYGTRKLDEWAHTFIEDYDDETFWGELSDRLAERDFIKDHTDAEIKKMKQADRFQKIENLACAYEGEFCEHGLDNIVVRPSTTNVIHHPFKANVD